MTRAGLDVVSSDLLLVRELVALQTAKRKSLSLDERRRQYDLAEVAFASHLPHGVQAVNIGGCGAEWSRPHQSEAEPVLLYLHGGAYVLGSARSHRHLAAAIGAAAAAAVLSLDYRRAPEHPFPAALEDALSAYRFLLASGVEPSKIVLAGDSAGAGLALATLLGLRDADVPRPAAAVCISPWVDLTCRSAARSTRADRDPLLSADELSRMANLYLGRDSAENPLASPIFADLRALPPLLVQVGSDEILLDDARELARIARAAGVAVELEEWPEMFHVWHWYFPVLKEARAAIDAIGAFVIGATRGE